MEEVLKEEEACVDKWKEKTVKQPRGYAENVSSSVSDTDTLKLT